MTVFIFDVETSGKPDFKRPADHPDQPYICEVAALLMDGPGSVIGELNTLIKPDRWLIDPATEGIHGISVEMCEAKGRPIEEALVDLTRLMDQADVVAGFSVDFDLKMYRGACRRAGLDDRYAVVKDKRFDVMRACKPLCKIPPTPRMRQKRGFKLPKLSEAVEILLHRAMIDCRATAELYWYMRALDADDFIPEERAEIVKDIVRDQVQAITDSGSAVLTPDALVVTNNADDAQEDTAWREWEQRGSCSRGSRRSSPTMGLDFI